MNLPDVIEELVGHIRGSIEKSLIETCAQTSIQIDDEDETGSRTVDYNAPLNWNVCVRCLGKHMNTLLSPNTSITCVTNDLCRCPSDSFFTPG
jgi:hypothetical protein